MALSSNLNKILKTNPEILIKKAFRKAYGKFENVKSRKNDTKLPSYTEKAPKLKLLEPIIDLPEQKFLDNYKNEILGFAKHSLNHEFKLLSPNYIHLHYGIKGEKYQSEVNSVEKAIKQIIPVNSNRSLELFKLLDLDYLPIDWQLDHLSGYRWNVRKWFKDISYGYDFGVDVKRPWELGRMQDLPNLALAFALENNEKYLIEFQNRVIDFYALNPPRYGIQWKTAMDVGIRAVNILASYTIFLKSEAKFKDEFEQILELFLYDHLIHIHENNEFAEGQRGNHHLTNVVSILLIASNFERSNLIEYLLEKYSSSFFTELNYQFYPDGGNFEASIPYHLLSTELVLTAFNYFFKIKPNDELINKIKLKITNKSIREKLNKIIDFSISNLHSGYIPKIGDHDSGRYFSIFDNTHFYYNFFKQLTEFRIQNKFPERGDISNLINSKNSFKIFQNFGLATNKNNKYEITCSFIKLGQKGKGGHNHNDTGSFVLSAKSRPFIIDPGTYCYTSNWKLRNQFRSTAYHNTIVLDNYEQNKFQSKALDDLFWLFSNSEPFAVIPEEKSIKIIDPRFKKPIIREFIFKENQIEIIDKCDLKINKKLHFHLHPRVDLDLIDGACILKRENIILELKMEGKPRIEKFYYSPNYGTKIPSNRIVFDMPDNMHKTEILLK